MEGQLFINDQEVDLGSGLEVAMTYGVNDLHDLKSRQGAYSTTIKLPKTAKNLSIIGNSDKVLSGSTLPYSLNIARIDGNGVTIVEGSCLINNVSDEIELFIASDNGDWISRIGDKSLQDLDSSSLDFTLTQTHVEDFRANDWENGMVYPNADYGAFTYRDGVNVRWSELKPWYYVKWLVRRIFLEAGFTITGGDVWNSTTNKFKDMVVNCGDFQTGYPNYSDYFSASVKRPTDYTMFTVVYLAGIANSGTYASYIDFATTINDQSASWDNASKHYTCPTDGYYQFSSLGIFKAELVSGSTPTTGSTNADLKVEFYINGTLQYTASHSISFADLFTTGYSLESSWAANLYDSDLVQVKITCDQPANTLAGAINSTIRYVLKADTSANFTASENILGNYTVPTSALLPTISQADLLKYVANLYGCVFVADSRSKEVTLQSFESIATKYGQAPDWTSKVDTSESSVRTFRINGYGQRNYLQYINDANDPQLNQINYGRGYFDISDLNLQAEKVVYQSPLSLCKGFTSFQSPYTSSGRVFLPNLPLLKNKANSFVEWYDSTNNYIFVEGVNNYAYYQGNYFKLLQTALNKTPVNEPTYWKWVKFADVFDIQKVVPRVGYIQVDSTTKLTVESFATEATQPNLYFTEIKFDTAITNEYSVLVAALDSCKVVQTDIKLSHVDVERYQLDPLQPVWLYDENGEGAYYYINQITQFKPFANESTRVSLIRL